MTLPGTAASYWIESSTATSYPPLTEDIDIDVAVVGGGIAGISTAFELIRAGRSVRVLEAGQIAAAVTGHTTGRLSAAHPWIYRPLRERQGAEAARLYACSQQNAVDHVAATASALGIDCEIERRPSHVFTDDEDQADALRAEAEAVKDAGLDASFVTETDLPFTVAGALRVEGQIQFHPRRYLVGLAEAIVRDGGLVHENTRVNDIEEGEPCTLRTEHGAIVRAQDVVVATLAPVFEQLRLSTRLSAVRELVVAAPISADRDPGGMYITRELNTRSVRTAPLPDGRRLLLITGEAFAPGSGQVAERYERLIDWAREHFGATEITHRWSAQDTETTDTLPWIGHAPGTDHIYLATGYARSGMSHGVMTGRLLADLLTGRTPAWADLYDPGRVHPIHEASGTAKNLAAVAGHYAGDRVDAATGSIEDVPRGGGRVVTIGGRPCAVHRGEHGNLTVLSAACPHRGCLVAFNDTERTWECPCHGSRFAADGTLLDGPANRPLGPITMDDQAK
ncbi:FAD-dependent oxidoreductase [Actinoallomurus acaciae]|uniref:FAD-dependent oxidoreductase n=1 Tax=Actinoallomurus acaciae TaxID=502577 RepID=A0ABV5YAB2_9ACTN